MANSVSNNSLSLSPSSSGEIVPSAFASSISLISLWFLNGLTTAPLFRVSSWCGAGVPRGLFFLFLTFITTPVRVDQSCLEPIPTNCLYSILSPLLNFLSASSKDSSAAQTSGEPALAFIPTSFSTFLRLATSLPL